MFIGWAVMRVVSADLIDRWTVVQLVPAVIHLVVAFLFFRREKWVMDGSVSSILWSLPSFVAGGVAISLAPASHQWSVTSQLAFLVCGIGTLIGLLFLGKSFSIFPALRSIVSHGPFQIVRHPIYFCELMMIAVCCWAGGELFHVGIFIFALVAIVLRILFEERVLLNSNSYVDYCRTTKYRLVPRVW
jgi:protein-S-isoprenylcysteine O-methyltransferase Ste14